MTIFDLVSAQAIATYWNETASNRIPYLGDALFPAKKKLGLDLSWIKGYKGLPVALKPSHFDAKAEVRDRIGVEKVETEMPFFREAMTIKEKDRQELLKLKEANSTYYETVIRQIYDDNRQLIEGALVQAERMRMQLLTTGGKINISAGGLSYLYDFDKNGEYKSKNYMAVPSARTWTDYEKATPVQDFIDAMEKVEEKQGVTITRALMSRRTWSHLLQNKSIKMDMNVLSGQHIILTDTMLSQYIAGKVGLQMVRYNKKYKDETGAEKSFFPDGYVLLIPDGNLGNTWFGTTPEEADLMGGTEAQVAIIETGIALTTHKEYGPPVNVKTVVSEIVLPSYERMNETFLMKVF